jgi:hypothetical protein
MNNNDIIINALNPTFQPTFSVTDMPSAVIIINPTSFPTSSPTLIMVDLNTDNNNNNKKVINIYIYISISMFFITLFFSILYNKYVNSIKKKKKKHFKLTDRPNLNNINTINFTDLTIQTNEAIV